MTTKDDGPHLGFLEMPEGYKGPVKLKNPGVPVAEIRIIPYYERPEYTRLDDYDKKGYEYLLQPFLDKVPMVDGKPDLTLKHLKDLLVTVLIVGHEM